jgi:CBS domain containing-hemolysin-like protein
MDPNVNSWFTELVQMFFTPFISFIVRLIYIIIWYIDLLMKASCGVEEARVFVI